MGDCCQMVTRTSPLAPLPLSKLKTFFFFSRTDLQNAKLKDADSNFIYFEQSTTNSL